MFEQADELFNNELYDEAFAAFASIANNPENDSVVRSDAYNMMGLIIAGPCPYLTDSEDESGLPYFKLAFNLNDKNFAAAHNLIEGYDTGCTGHYDKETAITAYKIIKNNRWNELSERHQQMVNKIQRKLNLPEQE